jgi:HK97 gp10 family phage protein
MNFTNTNKVLHEFGKLNGKLQNIVVSEMEIAGRSAEFTAKKNAPVDLGKHRQGINYQPENDGLSAALYANESYSPYLEFGTGGYVDIPQGFEDLASQFKGQGKRKINMKARPHIIPACKEAHQKLVKKLETRLTEL